MTPGKRIIELRESIDINQTELAQKIEINRSVLNRIEQGTRAIRDDELKKLADFFHVSTDYLLGRDEEQPTDDIARTLLQSEEKEKTPNRTIEMLRTYAALPPDKKVCAREYISFLSNTCQNKQPIQQDK